MALIACHDCDAVYRPIALGAGEKARCLRCGAVLYREPRLAPHQMLALVLAALVVFVIANATPIVVLSVQGVQNQATLLGSVVALWNEGRQLVAGLVAATTLVAPLTDLGLMLLLLMAASRGHRPACFASLLRLVQAVRPWGMIEIFMLGVVVALVKLSHLAMVMPGIALWAFAALTVLLAIIVSWDPRSLWHDPARDHSE